MSNLIAYIPTLNQRHINWFRSHPHSYLFLISQEMAEEKMPRLKRNLSALPTETVVTMIRSLGIMDRFLVSVFDPENDNPRLVSKDVGHWLGKSGWENFVMPDEDISHIIAEHYLAPAGAMVEFEMIWARWDMTAVHNNQPVIPDVVISNSPLDNERMKLAERVSVKSPDWWRQIGAAAFKEDKLLAVACNTHMPNEYETYIFGDPRLNVDAGQIGKYVAMHSERAVVALCAKAGISTRGASIYVTTFPCEDCAREIAFAGFNKVFFRDGYSVLNAMDVLRSNGVQIIQVK